tara:strand:+ start:114 stop:422 length:309 start_codon:yes stop_codon:yes gene_type:complete
MNFTKLLHEVDFTGDEDMLNEACYDTMSVDEVKDDLEINGMSSSLLDFMDNDDIVECFLELVARVTSATPAEGNYVKLMEIEDYVGGIISFYVDHDKKHVLK